jgi:hypothetical protein
VSTHFFADASLVEVEVKVDIFEEDLRIFQLKRCAFAMIFKLIKAQNVCDLDFVRFRRKSIEYHI